MQLVDAPKPVYPARAANDDRVLKSAVVADLTINDAGAVKAVRLTRSSGIATYDKAVLEALKKWRYNKASGCGERSSKVTVNIDPRSREK